MAASLDLHLDRLRDLIAQVGVGPLFAAPLVTPEDTWFPDPWPRGGVEKVRQLLLRLAEYAALADLDVEVISFPEETAETDMPAPLIEQRAASGLTGSFYGIHEGRAWFGIEFSRTRDRVELVGILAHEMAHVWRQVRDIHVTPHQAEEECTDLTSIVLGFGILVANAAYRFHTPNARARDWLARTQGSYSVSGYIDVDDMAALLSCWAMLKQLPPEQILKHLGPTQAEAFRKAWAASTEEALRERLGIPADAVLTAPFLDGATEREFRLSLAAQRAHDCVKRLVELAGEDGGLVPEPIPYPAPVGTLPYRRLAVWGRMTHAGLWVRFLMLVKDPEWDTQAIVLGGHMNDDFLRLAVGHVRDAQASDERRLGALLAQAFTPGTPLCSVLVPSLPTFVRTLEGGHGIRELEPIFRGFAEHASPEQVVSETAWLREYRGHTALRLQREHAHGGIPSSPAGGRVDTQGWWHVVSDPEHTQDEHVNVAWYGSHYVREAPRPHADSERGG
jgi:hypothetical protein